MTDNEIIKALECCSEPAGKCCCEGCPLHHREDSCTTALIKKALELTNRQKAEIERLKFRKCLYSGLYSEYDIKQIRDCTQGECFHRESEELVRIEAIKKFVDKTEEKTFPMLTSATLEKKEVIYHFLDILNEVKTEMVGDDNA